MLIEVHLSMKLSHLTKLGAFAELLFQRGFRLWYHHPNAIWGRKKDPGMTRELLALGADPLVPTYELGFVRQPVR